MCSIRRKLVPGGRKKDACWGCWFRSIPSMCVFLCESAATRLLRGVKRASAQAWVAAKSHDHSLSFPSQAGKPVCHSRFEVSNEIIEPRRHARALTHIQRWRVRRPVTEPPFGVCENTTSTQSLCRLSSCRLLPAPVACLAAGDQPPG